MHQDAPELITFGYEVLRVEGNSTGMHRLLSLHGCGWAGPFVCCNCEFLSFDRLAGAQVVGENIGVGDRDEGEA